MAVTEQTPINSSTGNGVTTVFPYTFKIIADADLEVSVDGVVQVLNTDYTVSGAGNDAGGNVTFTTAPASLTTVVRRRNMAFTRATDYQYQGDLPNDVLNEDQDAPILMIQQLGEQVGRSVKVPVGDAIEALPPAGSRANAYLAFDADGNPIASSGTGADAGLRTDLASSGGAGLVTVLPAGVGGVAQTVAAWASKRPLPSDYATNADYVAAVQALATGTHFTQSGAIIHRLADRVFVGGAIDNDGTFPNVTKDWLTTYQETLKVKRVVGTAATGVTTSGSPVVTFTAGGIAPSVGAAFFADFAIPDGATVVSVDSATQVTLSLNATATTTGNTFYSNTTTTLGGSGVSANTFGLTNSAGGSAIGALYGSRSANFTSAGTSCIGLMTVAINDHATLGTSAWGLYVEAHRVGAAAGGTRGIEIDVSSTAAAEIDPNAFHQGQTAGLQIGAGTGLAGVLPSGTQVDISAAIQIVANPRRFKAGIVFGNNSIAGTDGVTVGAAPVLSMAPGHSLVWTNKDQAMVAQILVTNTAAATKTELRFISSGIQMVGATGQPLALINHVASAVNYPSLSAAVTGQPAAISAVGTDANIDLRFITTGTGVVRFGTLTANPDAAITGYISIKDSGGTARKLAVIA